MADSQIKCWEKFNCEKHECKLNKSDELYCWLVPDTCCRTEKNNEEAIDKIVHCFECDVFKCNVSSSDMNSTCELVSEKFKKFRHEISLQERERKNTLDELEDGLSQVFHALEKIAKGDPTVRIEESSNLELIKKLKHSVNETALNLGEIVDLSHEFAIGLAEHFDVLHRVSKGDLNARVNGTSEVELIEALKKITNQMIDSVAHEISERKRSESELRESETKFRKFTEELPVGFSIILPDNRFEYINPTFTEIFGYTIDEIPDRDTWLKKAYPDSTYRAYVSKLWNDDSNKLRGFKTSRPEELAVRCKDGEEKIIFFHRAKLSDGKYLMLYLDITEKAKAEEAVKESEEKYRMLIENIQDGVFIHQDGIVEFVNDAMAKMLGYTPGEITGRNVFDFVAPEDYGVASEKLKDVSLKKEYVLTMIHKDGKTRIIVRVNRSLFQYRNRPASIGTMKNITQQIRDEEEKKKLEAQLQRSRQMEAIGTLAGGVAHDLNNILSGILSYPDLLLLDIPEDSPLRKPLLTVKRSGEKASAIVQDLLTLARRAVPTSDIVDLNSIITEYLNSPEMENLKKFHPKVKIITDLEDDLFNIAGSSVHLSKTVMNLISNAAEAMPHGGNLRIATENRYIDHVIKGYDDVEEGDYIVLSIDDPGIGISEDDLQRIFEPFFTKKVMGRSGTGLGMAVVWGTVKDHNGYIDVSSKELKGTNFTLYFPACRKDAYQKQDQSPVKKLAGNGEKILVVDDVFEQREIAVAMLSKLGYDVSTTENGETALKLCQKEKYDLLLLDMIMEPGIDGLETYKRILKIRPDQKAIVASGFSLSSRVKEIQKLGAGEYVKKPYSLEKIASAVQYEIDRQRPNVI